MVYFIQQSLTLIVSNCVTILGRVRLPLFIPIEMKGSILLNRECMRESIDLLQFHQFPIQIYFTFFFLYFFRKNIILFFPILMIYFSNILNKYFESHLHLDLSYNHIFHTLFVVLYISCLSNHIYYTFVM